MGKGGHHKDIAKDTKEKKHIKMDKKDRNATQSGPTALEGNLEAEGNIINLKDFSTSIKMRDSIPRLGNQCWKSAQEDESP